MKYGNCKFTSSRCTVSVEHDLHWASLQLQPTRPVSVPVKVAYDNKVYYVYYKIMKKADTHIYLNTHYGTYQQSVGSYSCS